MTDTRHYNSAAILSATLAMPTMTAYFYKPCEFIFTYKLLRLVVLIWQQILKLLGPNVNMQVPKIFPASIFIESHTGQIIQEN
jgi:hypothetical protein